MVIINFLYYYHFTKYCILRYILDRGAANISRIIELWQSIDIIPKDLLPK